MVLKSYRTRRLPLFLFLVSAAVLPLSANATSCTTQAKMTPALRDALSQAGRTALADVQKGDVQGFRESAAPSVAADSNGLEHSVLHLEPLITGASITVEELYLLDASGNPAALPQTDFYCGSPVVVFNVANLPSGTYALAILHATGVPQPQQVSLILLKAPDGNWKVAGLFVKPMIAAGHDGLWYWKAARNYAQTKMDWNAWFYYRMARNLLDPLDFLSSPNLERLDREADQIRPGDLPGSAPMTIAAEAGKFVVTTIDTSTALGELDLDVHYSPDLTQAAQLSDPLSARKQVTAVMSALLRVHPELLGAFHGIWVHAEQGTTSLFVLELPMNQISASPSAKSNSAPR